MKIIADNKIPFLKGALELNADIEYCPGNEITSDVIKEADALIIRTRTRCNRELLEGSKVRFIASATIGFDHIDTAYCRDHDIDWTNAPGCNSSSVQQYIAAALVYLSEKYNFNLNKKTLGVIGVGNVGKKVVGIAEHLGMKVLLNDPPRERIEGPCGFISLEGICRDADIITFHVPLNISGEDKTLHMANDDFFKKVNPGSFIINSSRGEVMETAAAKQAMHKGMISGAVVDVWENEPGIDRELLDIVSLGTPHIAGYSADGKANGTMMSVRAVSRFFDLGLDDWEPENIPLLEKPLITIDGRGKSELKVLSEAVKATYQIQKDDERLRKAPGDFEKLRANYPLRREFPAYSVRLKNANNEISLNLQRLGFKLHYS